MATLPLSGIRVLSLAEQYPGPYATMLLADLGADVILIERPGTGDPSRRFPGLFSSFNRNKRSVALNLKSEEGRNDFLALVDTADAVIEGFRPGVMGRLGLDSATLRARKPSLICASISSFGQNGPMASVAGHDLSIQAAAGMISVPPGQEATYVLPVLPLADIASAMFATLGVVTALFARASSGIGASIDVSMLDSLVSWMTPALVPPLNGLPTRPLPPLDPGYGLFATRDGRQITLSIAGEDNMWAALCEILNLPQYASLSEDHRSLRAKEIDPQLRIAIAGQGYEVFYAQLEAKGIAFGPVLNLQEVLNDPQMLARGLARTISEGAAAQTFVGQPIAFEGMQTVITRPSPQLGEHNGELLGALLDGEGAISRW